MSVTFVNIRSKETRICDTEPKIAAFWESSDHSTNVSQGQDFGWRVAPSLVVRMRHYMEDFEKMEGIAKRAKKEAEELTESDVLYYISQEEDRKAQASSAPEDYTDEYMAEIREMEKKYDEDAKKNQRVAAPITTEVTTESLADMEKRVKLEERLAQAKLDQATAEELSKPDDTTTTTTTKAK